MINCKSNRYFLLLRCERYLKMINTFITFYIFVKLNKTQAITINYSRI